MVLQVEGLDFEEVPLKVTQRLLQDYGFAQVLSNYGQSPAQFIMDLHPEHFNSAQSTRMQGYWSEVKHVQTDIRFWTLIGCQMVIGTIKRIGLLLCGLSAVCMGLIERIYMRLQEVVFANIIRVSSVC